MKKLTYKQKLKQQQELYEIELKKARSEYIDENVILQQQLYMKQRVVAMFAEENQNLRKKLNKKFSLKDKFLKIVGW